MAGNVIPVGNRIHGVFCNCVKTQFHGNSVAVQADGGTGDGSGTERGDVQAPAAVLELEPLLANVSCVLRSYGRLYLVHRANRIVDLVSLCRKYQLEIKTMQFVYDQRKECAGAILIEAIKNGKVGCTVQNSKIISF